MQKVHDLCATDAGVLNFQQVCGHVVWMKPKHDGANAEAFEVWQAWEKGDHEIFISCYACLIGAPVHYPLGTKLPIPMSPEMMEAIYSDQGIPI